METKIKVVTSNNQVLEIEVLDIFQVSGYDHDYIMYSLGEDVDEENEQVYISILKNDYDSYSLEDISDDKEWEDVEKALLEEVEMESDDCE